MVKKGKLAHIIFIILVLGSISAVLFLDEKVTITGSSAALEKECMEEWDCTEWDECLPSGVQYRECNFIGEDRNCLQYEPQEWNFCENEVNSIQGMFISDISSDWYCTLPKLVLAVILVTLLSFIFIMIKYDTKWLTTKGFELFDISKIKLLIVLILITSSVIVILNKCVESKLLKFSLVVISVFSVVELIVFHQKRKTLEEN